MCYIVFPGPHGNHLVIDDIDSPKPTLKTTASGAFRRTLRDVG